MLQKLPPIRFRLPPFLSSPLSSSLSPALLSSCAPPQKTEMFACLLHNMIHESSPEESLVLLVAKVK